MFNSSSAREKFTQVLEHFHAELDTIRAGRATPAIIENVQVDAYGSKMPINQLANITVIDPTLLGVNPWDKSNVQAVAKAITGANLGLNPVIDGDLIRIPIPALSEERRTELAKSVNQIAEKYKISLRQSRHDLYEEIEKDKEGGEITEDEEKDQKDKLQKLVDEYNKSIEDAAKGKEEELMKV